jgi:hypothetical protein
VVVTPQAWTRPTEISWKAPGKAQRLTTGPVDPYHPQQVTAPERPTPQAVEPSAETRVKGIAGADSCPLLFEVPQQVGSPRKVKPQENPHPEVMAE